MSEELLSTFDIRGTETSGLSVDVAWNVGKALADWLPAEGAVVIVYIPTQKHLAEAVIEGIRLQGRDVVDGGFGDRDAAKAHISTHKLAGGVVVGADELEKASTIELYQYEAKLIDSKNGLTEIRDLVNAGNFVPAVTKGERLMDFNNLPRI